MALFVYYNRLKCSVLSFMFTLTFERGLGVAAKQGGKVIAVLKKNIEENDGHWRQWDFGTWFSFKFLFENDFWNSTFFLFFHSIDNL